MAAATWMLVALALRYSSLAALVAAAAAAAYSMLPMAFAALPAPAPIILLAMVTAVLIYVRHHENIGRLIKGTEPRIGASRA